MSNNFWLYKQLEQKSNLTVDSQFNPLVVVEKNGIEYKIYTPKPEEYLIDIDVVQKAREMGANVISFPTSWCRASSEAISYGRVHKIQVIPHGKLFEILS
jgi:hypothetical protein